ncbi:MAG: histidine triad nucleotide-binding protein [Treponema sp.]|jgi:histidine triad (HIT) family protein|nr:histidine triad nucleotide-binding protein [Treponema sp.]
MSDCIFCKIIAGELPANKVYEDDDVLAFDDIKPKAPVHLLVIPKKHIANIMEVAPEDSDLLGRLFFKAQEIAKIAGCGEKGARFVVNCKSDGGQTVNHLHCHIFGGRFMTWPPG